MPDAEQHQKTRANFCNALAGNIDGGRAHSLQ
jgi:hypothetical protein